MHPSHRSHRLLLLALVGACAWGAEPAERIDFERQILPLFEHKCFECHSSALKKPKGDLRLDDAEAIRAASGKDGVIVPGKPEASALVKVIALPPADDDVMPPAKESSQLTKPQIKLISDWVAQGAKTGTWVAARAKQATPRPTITKEEARDTARAAAALDRVLLEGMHAKGVKPAPAADDATFLRRVHLDLVGRNPTADEARRFLAERSTGRRTALIDRLLASEGHVSRAFNHWADALRARNDFTRTAADTWLFWLKQSLRDNKPYDRMVAEMLTAEGRFWRVPATGMRLRDSGNQLAGVEATSALFLGTQIGCAQCHDHPYDRWTRRDYHAFAGYITGMNSFIPQEHLFEKLDGNLIVKQQGALNEFGRVRNVARDRERRGETGVVAAVKVPPLDGVSPAVAEQVLALSGDFDFDSISYGTRAMIGTQISGPGKEWSKYFWTSLPKDYQYQDAKPGERIPPAVLFGEARKVEKPQEFPAVFADWLTAPDNLRFTQVIANRMWAWMMGASLCGPLTDVLDAEQAADPRLVRHLEALMIATGYDLRQFLRILANTQAYQRQSVAAVIDDQRPVLHPGPVIRRLSAEEVWDSLVALVDADLDAGVEKTPPEFTLQERLYAAKTMDEYWLAVIAERTRQREEKDTYFDRLRKVGELKRTGFDPKGMIRASELQSPAPEGHFLRIFGQSDRELIDHAWVNPTVPQALALMNGPIFAEIVKPGSAFRKALDAANNLDQRLDVVFLAILARLPTPAERRLLVEARPAAGERADEDLAWTLINTRQFLFTR
jgi:hypothetical protein